MHPKNDYTHMRKMAKWARYTERGWLLLLALLIAVVSMPGLGAIPVFALPRDPIDPDPVGGNEPVTPPDNGFAWSVPSRFGVAANGIVDYHWHEITATYDVAYVYPTGFPVNIDGCRNDADAIAGTSPMTYTWTLDGQTTIDHTCRFQRDFDAQGSYTLSLKITDTNGNVVLDAQGRGNPFTQNVVVKDILIVSLGDSYASGEGSPDVPQVLGNNDIFGNPTAVLQPARWEDTRCHRSANAAPAQAALAIEAADPHSSVTFLSFACSGATINTPYYKDAPTLDPYAPGQYNHPKGTGILGPYAGAVPPDPDHPENNQLPSQIDQLVAALTNHGQITSPRRIDALLLSGGGNDMGFGNIASLCALYYQCPTNVYISASNYSGKIQLRNRVQQDLATLPDRHAALAAALRSTQLNIGKVYITQYPDSTRNDQGDYCGKILDDVIPGWMQPLLALKAALENQPVPFLPYQVDRGNSPDTDEVAWAGGTVLTGLNGAVGVAAQANGWTLVDGIADSSANLFSGHGYCASDNWIRRASDAVNMQGPWVPWNETLIPPASTLTKGTLHPTSQGYLAVASRIIVKLAPDLLPPPAPSGPPPVPTLAGSSTQSLVGANGWLIGHSAGVSCPSGAANCAFAQEAASVDASTAIRGAALLINGTRAVCTAAGVTVNGVLCTGQLANAQTYNWSFTFTNDGIFRLEFTVSARNGTTSKFSREVKVDLYDPTATSALSSPTPSSGWYQTPVTVTLTGADGSGSGIQSIQYQLDGASSTQAGNSTQIGLNTDSVHTITYQAVDFAGRSSASQSFTVKVDQTKPTSSAAVSPTPNGTGWNKDNIAVTLSTTDNGGSGIQTYTYSATGAQPIASTPVNGSTPTQLSINSEGVTTISFGATDVAGNVENAKSITIRLDKTAPVVQCAAPDGQWHASDVSIACTASENNGSSVASADASFSLTTNVPNGTESANAATNSRTVCDLAGNCAAPVGPVGGNQVDKKAPSVSASAQKADNTVYTAGAWTTQTVSVHFTCSDAGSGVAVCPADQVFGVDGTFSASGTATDNTGNAASASFGPIQIDKTAPTVSVTGVVSGATYALGTVPAAGCNTTDALSGVATAATLSLTGGNAQGVGTFTATCRGAHDNVGNTSASVSVQYTVDYNLNKFVVLAQDGLSLQNRSVVVSGDVGARAVSRGPFLNDDAEVSIGGQVSMRDPTSRLLGNRLIIGQDANVYNPSYNGLTNQGTVLGTATTPINLALIPRLPALPSITPGAQNLTVPDGGALALDSGSYGKLTVRARGVVTFTGGVYHFAAWDVGQQVKLNFLAPSEIRIAGRLKVDVRSYVGPAPSASNLSAKDIVLYVAGQNGTSGAVDAEPRAAGFGQQTTLKANVVVPNGTLRLGENAEATGAFFGQWVWVGQNIRLTLASHFAP